MEFNRIIKLLRKERGITQKQAAEDLGVSQALLSHYEKGIRECGLDFVVRVADYYNVSCDYLLGRSAERNGMMLNADDLPNPDKMKDNVYHGSVLPTMNKKLISNSLNVLYAKIAECHSTRPLRVGQHRDNALLCQLQGLLRVVGQSAGDVLHLDLSQADGLGEADGAPHRCGVRQICEYQTNPGTIQAQGNA